MAASARAANDFEIQRQLSACGHECIVGAPSLIPRRARRARQQFSGCSVAPGLPFRGGRHGPSCIAAGSRLKFDQAVHRIVLEGYIAAFEATEARCDRLIITAQIAAALLPDWTLAQVVAALQMMRGMALVNAATDRRTGRSLALCQIRAS